MIFPSEHIRTQKGFSLIELLVVIAIIGTLSKIVLGSFTSARNKANDAVIKLDFSQLRTQASNYYNTSGTYGDGFTAANTPYNCTSLPATSFLGSSTPKQLIVQIDAKDNGISQCIADTANPTDATMWAIAATLSDGTIMCLDSTGVIKASSTASKLSYYPTAGAAVMFGVSTAYTASCK